MSRPITDQEVGRDFFSHLSTGARTTLLGPPLTIEAPAIEVFARSIPSTGMGGDMIDAVRHPDGALDLYLADVSGQGARAPSPAPDTCPGDHLPVRRRSRRSTSAATIAPAMP